MRDQKAPAGAYLQDATPFTLGQEFSGCKAGGSSPDTTLTSTSRIAEDLHGHQSHCATRPGLCQLKVSDQIDRAVRRGEILQAR